MIISGDDAARISKKLVCWLKDHPFHRGVDHSVLLMFLEDYQQLDLVTQVAEYVAWGGSLNDAQSFIVTGFIENYDLFSGH